MVSPRQGTIDRWEALPEEWAELWVAPLGVSWHQRVKQGQQTLIYQPNPKGVCNTMSVW